LQFPPKESCRILVNLDSRNGMNGFDEDSVNAWMHLPKVVKERFMDLASFKRSPEANDFLTLSEPAKSTRNKVDVMRDLDEFGILFRFFGRFSSFKIKRVWLRLEFALRLI